MISNLGYIQQSSPEVLANVQKAYTDTFGSGYILTQGSINGQWVQFNTLAAIQVENAKTELYGSIYNPNLTYGVWLDSVCKFNNIKRKPATSSTIAAVCNGLAGTIISIGSSITNDLGDIFTNDNVIVIGSSGFGTGTFRSVEKGKIPCGASTVNQIVTQISGWDSVNNPTDGITGGLEESDLNLRFRREHSLAINSAGSVNSITSALNENPDIINFGVQENPLDLPQLIQGVTIDPHSIYISIYANYTDALKNQIADIIYSKRYCTPQGNTTQTITDPVYNYVTFQAKWQTATPTPVQVDISIQNATSYPADIVALIKASIVANWDGEYAGIPKYQMQDVIDVTRFYPSLIALGVYQVNSMTIKLVTGGTAAQRISVSLDKVMTLSAINVNVSVV